MAVRNKILYRFILTTSFVTSYFWIYFSFHFWIGSKEDWQMEIKNPTFVVERFVITFLIGLAWYFLFKFIVKHLFSFGGVILPNRGNLIIEIFTIFLECTIVVLLALP